MEPAQGRTRRRPRVSVNKLGEYLVARPSRRQSIIEEQRTPSDFIVARYRDADEPVREYLLTGATKPNILRDSIDRLRTTPCDGEWDEVNRDLCVGVMERLPQLAASIEFGETRATPTKDGVLPVAGVAVHVRPEIILLTRRKGGDRLGAVKLCRTKTKPLIREAALYVAVILQRYLEVAYPQLAVERALCQVVDVFSGTVWTAPAAYKQRLKDVEAACREIFVGWESTRAAA